MTQLDKIEDLMHEKEVMEKWKGRFAEDELKEARQAGTIEWYDLRKGPHYTERQLIDYLQTRKKATCARVKPLNPEQPQPEGNLAALKSEANGSGKNKKAAVSIVTGMNPASAAESAAAALGQNL